MQPKLKIMKTVWQNTPIQISFVVVDLSVSREYPQNFLCPFPKNLLKRNQKGNLKRSKFFQIFGEKTYEMAKRLLEDALERETDMKIKTEIETRLKEVRGSKKHKMPCQNPNG